MIDGRMYKIMWGWIDEWIYEIWYVYIWSKFNIWNVNCAQATAFKISTHELMFLWKCRSFWEGKCLDLKGLEPQTFGFMPNALTIWAIRARHLLSHVFEYWLWRYRYFVSKVNIWNVFCARATAFIFDTTTDVTENISTWGGLEPQTFGFMPNALTIWAIRARHLLSRVFEYWLWCFCI